jgi:hypothetical protein
VSRDGREVHRYPIRLATRRGNRLWNRLLYVFAALEAFRVVRGLAGGELPIRPLVALAFMVAVLVYVHRSDRKGSGALVLSAEGVALARQDARWDEIERIAPKRMFGRWGKRYDAFVLNEPKPISRALVPKGWYDHIPLGYWWPDWRNSAIREDIARWAPRLLSGAAWWNPRSGP